MSYDHSFNDALNGVSFRPSPRYFVRLPEVCHSPRSLPLPSTCDYSFDLELSVKRAYEEYHNKKNGLVQKEESRKVERVPPTPALQPGTSTAVLQPSKPLTSASSSSSLSAGQSAGQQPSFEDFEGVASVFDELQLKTIDDRRALNELWGAVHIQSNSAVSFSAAAAPSSAPHSPLPVPTLPSTSAPSHAPVPQPRRTAPPPPPSTAIPVPLLPSSTPSYSNGHSQPSGQEDQKALIARKLITKGFRSHAVHLALSSLPQHNLPFVEYYIKGVTNMEKLSIPADQGMHFLLSGQLTDKHDVLRYADTVGQLVGMGFPSDKAMEATKSAKGDKVAALDACLKLCNGV